MKNMIFIFLFILGAQTSFAATKTLTATGRNKLSNWARVVSSIYGTAIKKLPPNLIKAENKTIPVYARDGSGFTVSGYVLASYNNSNITIPSGCSLSGNPNPYCNPYDNSCNSCTRPGIPPFTIIGSETIGAYATVGGLNFITAVSPNTTENVCAIANYGGQCYANMISTYTTVRLSCLVGVRRVSYQVGPMAYCNIPAQINGVVESYNVSGACLSDGGIVQQFVQSDQLSCQLLTDIEAVKAMLTAYKAYLSSCNSSFLSPERNYDLIEINQILSELENGVLLKSADISGDTNPPLASNPWAVVFNKLSISDGNNQTQIMGNPLDKQLKVNVTDTNGVPQTGINIDFSVTQPADYIWSRSVQTDSGAAETAFTLGPASGTYQINASCAECCPTEVSFTATALTNAQTTELRSYYCDTSAVINSTVTNGVRVRAVNRITGKAVPERAVTFTLVSHPGGTGMSLTPVPPDAASTNPQGVARAELALGSLPGNYRISAVCQSCEGNQEVLCNVNALARPNLYEVAPKVTPLILKKSPITVTLNPYIVPPGGTATVSVKGPTNLGLVPSVAPVQHTGGHQHGVEGRPHGMISPVMGITDENGDTTFTYTAGEVGGQERIIISAPELEDYGDAVVLVAVQGLVRLGPSPDYFLSGETPTHPSNHYGSELLRQEILNIAMAYTDEYGAFMRVDDMSLINGGLFDVCGNWNTAGCLRNPNGGHEAHRDGKNADFGYYHITTQGQRRRILDMYNRLNNLLLTHTMINCQTTYAGSHIECPRRN